MYPKAYLFHNIELEGLCDLISSPVLLTFSARQINLQQRTHNDVVVMLDLYNVINKPIYPKFVTCIYNYEQQDMLLAILKFGIADYCFIKSEEHYVLAKSLVNIGKKLESTMQNISGLEGNMRSCYKSLEALKLERLSPMEAQFIENLSTVLSVRKVAKLKLHNLIRAEFIAGIC